MIIQVNGIAINTVITSRTRFKVGKVTYARLNLGCRHRSTTPASRSGDFTVRETTIPHWKFYMLASWRCAPGSTCPITFTKEDGDTSEYEQRDSHELVLHERSRLRGKNNLTTIVGGSNKTHTEFFHKISTANQMVPRGSETTNGKAGPPVVSASCMTFLLCTSVQWLPVLRKTLLTETSKFRYQSTKLRLRRKTAAARLLGLWVRIPPGAWISVSCECCVLCVRRVDHSSRGILPSVVCLSVIVQPRSWESPGPLRAVAPEGGGGTSQTHNPPGL